MTALILATLAALACAVLYAHGKPLLQAIITLAAVCLCLAVLWQ